MSLGGYCTSTMSHLIAGITHNQTFAEGVIGTRFERAFDHITVC